MSRLYVIRSGDTRLVDAAHAGGSACSAPAVAHVGLLVGCVAWCGSGSAPAVAHLATPCWLIAHAARWCAPWVGSTVQPQPLLIRRLLSVHGERRLRARLLHRPYGRVRVTPLSGREEGRRTWGAAPRTDAMSVDLRPFGGTPPSGATLRKLIQKLATESFVNSPQVTEMTRSGVPRRRARAQRRRPAGRRR